MRRQYNEVGSNKSVKSAFAILEILRNHDGMRVTELANELDVAKSTAHRYLTTLQECECLVKVGDEYKIGLWFLDLGIYARNCIRGSDLIKQKVAELADITGERSQFVIAEHGMSVQVYSELGHHAVDLKLNIGDRIPLHAISPGKAIMAEWSNDRVEEHVMQYGLPSMTDNTITSRDALFEELDRIRELGYAVNDQEYVDGVRSVGVAVIDEKSHFPGALSVSGPSHRMDAEWTGNEIPNLLLGTAKELELNLRYLQ